MNALTVAVLVFVLGVACGRPEDAKYTTKYDNIDLDQIIANDRLLNNYVNCLLDTGKCSKDGEELKRVLPDALLTECSKCSEKQKEGSKKIIRHLIKNKRATWDKLEAKYDKDHVYLTKYSDELKKEGIQL